MPRTARRSLVEVGRAVRPADDGGPPLSLASDKIAMRASRNGRKVATVADLTIHELAEQEGVDPQAVFDWLAAGLPSELGPANLIVIDEHIAEAWLADHDDD